MAKIKDSVWSVFAQGTQLYFKNIGSFFKYLAFPVFGQVLGAFLIIFVSYIYSSNLPKWIVPGSLLDNFPVIFLILFIITLPGLIILIRAFWEYLVAYGAINSMVDNMLKSGRVYDFHAHTEVITRRSASFGWIWVIYAIFGIVGFFPLFWVIAGILSVYFILVFQVFTYEPDKSPIGCFIKSAQIIKGNFARTLGLMAILGVITYWIVPDLVEWLFDFIQISGVLAVGMDPWASQLPIKGINDLLARTPTAYQITSLMVAKAIVGATINYVMTCITLPLRSICCALWYKALNKGEVKLDKKILDRATSGE